MRQHQRKARKASCQMRSERLADVLTAGTFSADDPPDFGAVAAVLRDCLNATADDDKRRALSEQVVVWAADADRVYLTFDRNLFLYLAGL